MRCMGKDNILGGRAEWGRISSGTSDGWIQRVRFCHVGVESDWGDDAAGDTVGNCDEDDEDWEEHAVDYVRAGFHNSTHHRVQLNSG